MRIWTYYKWNMRTINVNYYYYYYLIQAMKNSVCPKRKLCEGRIFPNAEFSEVWIQHTTWWSWINTYWIFRKPNLCEYLPNVPKCGLNTRHDNREVTLIHLTRAQTDTSANFASDKCATGSIHANGSMTINVIPCWLFCRSGLCLVPSAIHLRSKLQATTILAGITIHWALRRIFLKIFCVSNDDKCYGENMS